MKKETKIKNSFLEDVGALTILAFITFIVGNAFVLDMHAMAIVLKIN